jgi:hypothetical protein
LVAIIGDCVIDILSSGTGIKLNELADVALDIGRTVGCSAYQNDFTLPDIPEEWHDRPPVGWYAEGAPAYIPGMSDPDDSTTNQSP